MSEAVTTTTIRLTRARRSTAWTTAVGALIVIALAAMPYLVYANLTDLLVNVFILLTIATMWNLLAGYAGLISVGQQAYLGVGAYIVLVLSDNGMSPFLAIPLAALGAAVIAVPIAIPLLRLRNEYFAIATWVVAEAFRLTVLRVPSLGGGTGATLQGLSDLDPPLREALTFWAALAVVVVAILATYLLLRSRIGMDLTAIRDNETAARSVGVRTLWAKRLVYVVAAAGAGAAGSLLIISQLNVQASSIFSVQWSAYMIFVALIGGLGSIEGPIIGTLIFFALQQGLADRGAWYLILLGAIAVVFAMWVPRGIWGLISSRFEVRLFPVGYWLHVAPATKSPPREA